MKMFRGYSGKTCGLKFIYNFENPVMANVADYIPAEILSEESSDFQKAVKLMVFVNQSLSFSSETVLPHPFNALYIMQRVHSGERVFANCWMYALVLQELLLSMGYKARMIRCMPMDLRFEECHCMVEAYVDSYAKWVILDASMCTYYMDKRRSPLGIRELREMVICGDVFIPALVPAGRANGLQGYLIKNLFRFERYQTVDFNMEEQEGERVMYVLLPDKYCITDKIVCYDRARIKYIHTHNQNEFWEIEDLSCAEGYN